jgi:hypothetical protein
MIDRRAFLRATTADHAARPADAPAAGMAEHTGCQEVRCLQLPVEGTCQFRAVEQSSR